MSQWRIMDFQRITAAKVLGLRFADGSAYVLSLKV